MWPRCAPSTSSTSGKVAPTSSRTPIRHPGVKGQNFSERGRAFFCESPWRCSGVVDSRCPISARVVVLAARPGYSTYPSSHSKALLFQSLPRCRFPRAGAGVRYAPWFSRVGVVLSYAPDTHQDQAMAAPRSGVRPALALASPRKPSVPGCVQVVRVRAVWCTSLDILLAMGALAHANPRQARNRGVSITTVLRHGAMWRMKRRPIIPWG